MMTFLMGVFVIWCILTTFLWLTGLGALDGTWETYGAWLFGLPTAALILSLLIGAPLYMGHLLFRWAAAL